MADLAKLQGLAVAAGAGTFKGKWESTGVVIAALDVGGMEYLLERCDGGEDGPILDFVEAADPDTVLALCELASEVDRFFSAQGDYRGSLMGALREALDRLKGA